MPEKERTPIAVEMILALDAMDWDVYYDWQEAQMAKHGGFLHDGRRFEFHLSPSPGTGGCFISVKDLLTNDILRHMGNA
jgi:hypothetical protein